MREVAQEHIVVTGESGRGARHSGSKRWARRTTASVLWQAPHKPCLIHSSPRFAVSNGTSTFSLRRKLKLRDVIPPGQSQ